MELSNESSVIERDACPRCRTSGNDTRGDNLAIYSDGHVHCFCCGYHRCGNGTTIKETPVTAEFNKINGRCDALPHRRLDDKTVRQYGYE